MLEYNVDLANNRLFVDNYNGVSLVWNAKLSLLTITDNVEHTCKHFYMSRYEAMSEIAGWLACDAFGFHQIA